MAQQLWFDLVPSGGMYSDDRFCSGPSNESAQSALQRSDSWSFGALVLVGDQGSGKSHLAEMWRHNNSGKVISASSIPLRLTGSIVVDNVDEQLDEEGLFHLLNRAVCSEAKVLLLARVGPSGWSVKLADLVSRIRALEVVRIDEPDDEVLVCILKKLSRDRSLRLDDKLLQYLVTRMERSSQSALRLVEALNARSLEGYRPVNRALARQVLDELEEVPQMLGLMDNNTVPKSGVKNESE